jgi:cyanate permease
VVTSGPRLGDLESGVAASLTTAGVAVVSGGLACVAGIALIAVLFPALIAYDGRQSVVP